MFFYFPVIRTKRIEFGCLYEDEQSSFAHVSFLVKDLAYWIIMFIYYPGGKGRRSSGFGGTPQG